MPDAEVLDGLLGVFHHDLRTGDVEGPLSKVGDFLTNQSLVHEADSTVPILRNRIDRRQDMDDAYAEALHRLLQKLLVGDIFFAPVGEYENCIAPFTRAQHVPQHARKRSDADAAGHEGEFFIRILRHDEITSKMAGRHLVSDPQLHQPTLVGARTRIELHTHLYALLLWSGRKSNEPAIAAIVGAPEGNGPLHVLPRSED